MNLNQERRVCKFMLLLAPSERGALERLAERDGSSGADVVRRLLREEARRVDVWRPGAAAVVPA